MRTLKATTSAGGYKKEKNKKIKNKRQKKDERWKIDDRRCSSMIHVQMYMYTADQLRRRMGRPGRGYIYKTSMNYI